MHVMNNYQILEILPFINVRDIKNIFNAVMMMIDDGVGDGDDDDERKAFSAC